jgi:hypothetical protein
MRVFLPISIFLNFLRPILNFAPRGKVWRQGQSCLPGVKFVPWGRVWSYPLGVKFSVHPSILLNSRECSPLGVNEGVNVPLGDKFHPWGPGVKLRMALWSRHTWNEFEYRLLVCIVVR